MLLHAAVLSRGTLILHSDHRQCHAFVISRSHKPATYAKETLSHDSKRAECLYHVLVNIHKPLLLKLPLPSSPGYRLAQVVLDVLRDVNGVYWVGEGHTPSSLCFWSIGSLGQRFVNKRAELLSLAMCQTAHGSAQSHTLQFRHLLHQHATL